MATLTTDLFDGVDIDDQFVVRLDYEQGRFTIEPEGSPDEAVEIAQLGFKLPHQPPPRALPFVLNYFLANVCEEATKWLFTLECIEGLNQDGIGLAIGVRSDADKIVRRQRLATKGHGSLSIGETLVANELARTLIFVVQEHARKRETESCSDAEGLDS
ncbi:hypothetical protein IH979_02985 [Patescibacteria group bacterium]|nr:hypothetical protein [Patescibacteria group bacterium]